jgi:hypothetical protein
LIKRRKLKRQVAAFEERKLLMNQGRYVSQKDKPEHNDKLSWISHYLDEWTRTTLHGRFKKEIEEQEVIMKKKREAAKMKLIKEQREGLMLQGTGDEPVFYRKDSLRELLEKDSLRYEDGGKKGVKA